MKVSYKQWDSDFFQLRIGITYVVNSEDLSWLEAHEKELREQYDLIYVFCPNTLEWKYIGATLVDEKTIYTKAVMPQVSYPQVRLYESKFLDEDLYRLALVSGEYSRYKTDSQWPSGSYDRLYRRWIEQSVNGNLANAVFVYLQEHSYKGMVTLEWKNSVADIGLVAVDKDAQRQGIGTKMIQTLENYLAENTDVKILKVATQWTNTKARALYEKQGFAVESITKIYHWWLGCE
ncbi:MAG TPA: GNAT family N-acetyltransferase [Paludibacteraceae bacterium]|nr:GNAT family N-acetyltransferase [Paludibacteraceae bacterium]HQJ90090.1 GNAT family N-acetyltransferase [Paludibacteraceae bacterium]